MPTLLQINSVANSGSTGHIAEDIGRLAIASGWESCIAYGRKALPSASHLVRIGNRADILRHVLVTRLFDLHGLASRRATKRLVRRIERIKPDVIHLHNIHGYYLNYKILFKYLARAGTPVVWTMHDCWAATGHCAYYAFAGCGKWQSNEGCRHCPQKKGYPKSALFSSAAYNFRCKKKYFNLLAENQLTIVTPSKWLSGEIAKSHLGHYRRVVINNGIDLDVFRPSGIKKNANGKFTILGVASVWDERKGLADFIRLADLLHDDEEIVLVGLGAKQAEKLPAKIKAVPRTENIQELVDYYSAADVYFNASVEETFGMTCIEAQACGTPVIAYKSTAVPETFCEQTGILVKSNDLDEVYEAIKEIKKNGKSFYANNCIEFVKNHFSGMERIKDVINLYKITPPRHAINGATEKKIILGVASVWDERKGLADLLHDDEEIVLVGLSEKQIDSLPKDKSIRGIGRTESQKELAELYSSAVCFVNPTYEDTFPTTNLEALACGTPVITYRTGGSPEIIDEETGFVVEQGDIDGIYACMTEIEQTGKAAFTNLCRKRAVKLFGKIERFEEYVRLYNKITAY